ncbi:MAG TPA: NAD+ synthase [Fimbriimonadales bacterium]|nr:NAD+ synthase [Fimbriimonadales bacterium]
MLEVSRLPIIRARKTDPESDENLRINPELVTDFLVRFLRDECIRRRGVSRAVVGVSGGVDSSVTTCLCVRAFGAENVFAFRLPYKTSSPESLTHAQMLIEMLGVPSRTIEITPMADGYLQNAEPDADPRRIGNVCARCRMVILFDQSMKLHALPIGTSNKTERMFGYFTWHADDAPPINPLGDLFKTQVYKLARYLGVPKLILEKPPSADLVVGQTTEGDWGISIPVADRILALLLLGYREKQIVRKGFREEDVRIVKRMVDSTHWKRKMPTVAMISTSAIGEYYLRPVDY